MDFDEANIEFRTSNGDDFAFAWGLYRDSMEALTLELMGTWNEPGQKNVVNDAATNGGTSIILIDGTKVGWLQTCESPDRIYLGQIYILPAQQNRGVGTAILRQLGARARLHDKAFVLDVMKNNRARALYERLGFRVVGESKYKFKMQWLK